MADLISADCPSCGATTLSGTDFIECPDCNNQTSLEEAETTWDNVQHL